MICKEGRERGTCDGGIGLEIVRVPVVPPRDLLEAREKVRQRAHDALGHKSHAFATVFGNLQSSV